MASLIRITKTYFVLNGVRVPSSTPGAQRVREKVPKWYGQGVPGYPPRKRFPLATDKTAAQRMLNDLVRDAEQGRARIPDQAVSRKSLDEHLKDFEADLALGLASSGSKRRRSPPSAKQVALVVQRVRDVLRDCRLKSVADLGPDAPSKVGTYLRERVTKRVLRTAKTGGPGRGVSAQTATFMLAGVRRFVRWLADKRAIGVSPNLFDSLAGFDPSNERVHARREVSPEELLKLLNAAKGSRQVVRGLAGVDRFHLYLTAFATGFRASELAALTPEHFDFSGESPIVSLSGKKTKNKKATTQPLPPEIGETLQEYLVGKPLTLPVWPGEWRQHAAKMLRVDLANAGVPYCVAGPHGNEFADFHALRHTFCSTLAAAGTGAKELQVLARHSDVRLTLGLYTHARSPELARAVGKLKLPGSQAARVGLEDLSREELESAVGGLLFLLKAMTECWLGDGKENAKTITSQ